jgi:hypothetical protein
MRKTSSEFHRAGLGTLNPYFVKFNHEFTRMNTNGFAVGAVADRRMLKPKHPESATSVQWS